jgi:tetratricopeptide (TPR) repeat protein
MNNTTPAPGAISGEQQGQRLSIPQAMQRAAQLQAQGKLVAAEKIARQILAKKPQHPMALHLLGLIAHQSGKTELAVNFIRKAIASNGQIALFHSNIGEMLRTLGKLDEAIAHSQRAISLAPKVASAYANLGIAFLDKKDLPAAKHHSAQALALNPALGIALNNLGSIYREEKDWEKAVAYYQKAADTSARYIEPLNNMGAVLTENEQHEAAIAPLQQALAINPQYAEALCNLGCAYIGLEDYAKALDCLQAAVKYRPVYAEAYINMARIFQERDNIDTAERCARRAIEQSPENPAAHVILASILAERMFPQQAMEHYHTAIALKPDQGAAYLGLGNLHMELGDMEQAKACFNKALELDNDNLGARFHLAQISKTSITDDNFMVLTRLAENPGELNHAKSLSLNFALGKIYDDLKDHEKSFRHYMEGCRLKRQKLEYSASANTDLFESIATIFSAEKINRLRQELGPNACTSTLPVFVLGMPRSGTTLTEQIIASHPQVYGAGELQDLLKVASRATSTETTIAFPHNLHDVNARHLAQWGPDYVAGLQSRAPGYAHITDKMPANFLGLGLIHLMLPNAKIVHVKRNPVDTCVSCFTRLFQRNQNQSYDLEELGSYYHDYAMLMQHWKTVLPANAFYEVQYEELVNDNETQAKALIDFCGLPWDDACLESHKTERSIRTASVMQVRQPVYTSSVEKWRNYETFLGPLFKGLKELAPTQQQQQQQQQQ